MKHYVCIKTTFFAGRLFNVNDVYQGDKEPPAEYFTSDANGAGRKPAPLADARGTRISAEEGAALNSQAKAAKAKAATGS